MNTRQNTVVPMRVNTAKSPMSRSSIDEVNVSAAKAHIVVKLPIVSGIVSSSIISLGEDIWLLLRFISNAALLGTMIYAVLFGLVAFGAMLIINFLFVDKPFKFWNKKETITVGEEVSIPVALK